MNKLHKNINIVFLISVRECFNLKLRFVKNTELYRKKIIKAITIVDRHKGEYRSQIKFYIKTSKLKLLHRENGPAKLVFIDGKIDEVYWYKYGKIHRDGKVSGPARIWFIDGILYSLTWFNNNKLHRFNKPAWIGFDINTIKLEWYLYGKLLLRKSIKNYIE